MNFATLPNLIALAVLVCVFWAISRKATSERLHLWLAGWILVLLHFAADFLRVGHGVFGQALTVVSLDLLLLAGVAFLLSVVGKDSTSRQHLAISVAVPATAYVSAAVCGVTNKNLYLCIVAGGLLAPWLFFGRELARSKLRAAGLVAVGGSIALVAGWAAGRGTPELGTAAILAALNFAIAVCYARTYRRHSTGVVTTVIGFTLWGAGFPIAIVLKMLAPAFRVQIEAWNISNYLVAVGMMLTLFEDQIETSRYHAYHDELTGLPNRRLLEDRLGLALAHARRAKTKLAVFQIDLNRFKEVNDTYGHRAGDVALREVAARLTACLQPGDTLARSGGDEFTLVTQFESKKSTDALVAALETTLMAPILIDSMEVHTGLSLGLAVYPDDGMDRDQLHAAADRAMYAAKRARRGGVAYDASDDAETVTDDGSKTMMPIHRR